MAKYLVKRILYGAISIIIVVAVVMILIYSLMNRDLIFANDASYTHQNNNANLEYRFYKAYGMEIEDKRTVYGECVYRLVPREDEPSVCLMHDWIYLPTA